MSSWAPPKYKTTHWSPYHESLKRRGSFAIWNGCHRGVVGVVTGSTSAIQACLTMKVLFGMPLRQTAGFVESFLWLVGLDCAVPDFSTLCRRQKTLNVGLPYRGGTGPLNLLIPSRDITA